MDADEVNRAIQYFKSVITEHYSDFEGRVSRRNFWTYVAVYISLAIIVYIAGNILRLGVLMPALQLALLMPSAGITARRLQDTGRSGQLVWILVVPVLVSNVVLLMFLLSFGLFGLLILFFPLLGLISLISLAAAVLMIYWCIQPGTDGPNEFGPPPTPAAA
ncbi:MAG TPA: DUF805 domain-containing protein [Micropepsaceae bacterium]|nr:DUF805 domain-containing protein [Micropepsaceae bacterium]